MTADIRVVNEFLDSLILHPKTPDEVRGGESLYYDWDSSLPFSSELYATEIWRIFNATTGKPSARWVSFTRRPLKS